MSSMSCYLTASRPGLIGAVCSLHAVDGNDRVFGGTDDERVFGDADDDRPVKGGAGDDIVDGGDGNDQLGDRADPGAFEPDADADTYLGGSGDDLVQYGAHAGVTVTLN